MKLSELKSFLNTYVEAALGSTDSAPSLFLWGAPGIGKSQAVKQVAKEQGIDLVDVRLSQLAPTDLRGLPYVPVDDPSSFTFVPPKFFPTEGKGIIFIDEFNMASPAMMGIAQQLVLDREVGDYKVPDGWLIIGAGNRSGKDNAAVSLMPAPVANRFLHVDVTCDLDDFLAYFSKELKGDIRIASFLRFKSSVLWNMPRSASESCYAWASPRSWVMANWMLEHKFDPILVSSAIGQSVAAEFNAFLKVWQNLPDVQPILDGDGKSWGGRNITDKPSLLYALIGQLLSRTTNGKQSCNVLDFLLSHKDISEDYVAMYVSQVASTILVDKLAKEKSVLIKHCTSNKKAYAFLRKVLELIKD